MYLLKRFHVSKHNDGLYFFFYFQPSHRVIKHFESIYAWPRSAESFEEILASKGQEYFRAELIVDLSSLSENSSDSSDSDSGVAEGDTVPTSAAASGGRSDVKTGTELNLGVVVMDGCKDRS